MIKILRTINLRNAQSATELAVFGAVLIFVLGLMIKYAVNFHAVQGMSMRALRKAVVLSRSSDNRRLASVIIIEDRDLPDLSTPLAISQRTTFAGQAAVSYNQKLFSEMDYGDPRDLPIVDLYINDHYYMLTTAAFKDYRPDYWNVDMSKRCPQPHNHGVGPRVCTKITENDPRFDRSQVDWFAPGLDPTTAYWQWYPLRADAGTILSASRVNSSVDLDGDNKEEVVLGQTESGPCSKFNTLFQCVFHCNLPWAGQIWPCCENRCHTIGDDVARHLCERNCVHGSGCGSCCGLPGTTAGCFDLCFDECFWPSINVFTAIDYQEGDLDLTVDSGDIAAGRTTQGLRPNQSSVSTVTPMSSLYKEEETTHGNLDSSSVQRRDYIYRTVQLNCRNPGSCCSDNVRAQVLNYPSDSCDPNTGELHVVTRSYFGKTRTWFTPQVIRRR